MSDTRGQWAMSLGLLVLLALATGVLTPMQSAANAKLAKEGTGSPVLAAAVNTAVGTLNLVLIAAALYFASSLPSRPQGGWGQVPWWGWAGGVPGSLYVVSLAFLAPRLGVGTTIGLVVCAQLLTSLFIDQFGWLGLEARPIEATRVAGALLIVAGAFLLQWRSR